MDKQVNAVKMEGGMSNNLLTPGMTYEVVPGRAMVIHEDCRVKGIARFADVPYRHAGVVQLLRLDTFVDYVKKHAAGGVSPVVFVSDCSAKAVFNAHGWGDDVAEFDLFKSAEWQVWMRHNCSWMSQEEFWKEDAWRAERLKKRIKAERMEFINDSIQYADRKSVV